MSIPSFLQSRISSEDWARTFKFDDVDWPNQHTPHSYNSISALASAVVEDILTLSLRRESTPIDDKIPCSAMIFAVGGSASGKTQTVFGSSIAELISTEENIYLGNEMGESGNSPTFGLLGEIISGILLSRHLSGNRVNTEGSTTQPVLNCSLSILEIVNEDVLRDILGCANGSLGEHGGSKTLRVRHSDSRGATVSNLQQASIRTMGQFHELLLSSFQSKILRRAWSNEGGHGHFVVDIPNCYCLESNT